MLCALGMVADYLYYHQTTVEHALGFPSIRHNELIDITAGLLTEVCHSVGVEPSL